MFRYIFKFAMVGILAFFGLVLALSIKENVSEEIATRHAEQELLTDEEIVLDVGGFGDKKQINYPGLVDLLRKIDEAKMNPVDEAYDFYKEKSAVWKGNPSLLKEYFDGYFELRFALDLCYKLRFAPEYSGPFTCAAHGIEDIIEVAKNLDDKYHIDWKKDAQKILRESKYYRKNAYLFGQKALNSGILGFIESTKKLKEFMQRNLQIHAQIPAANMMAVVYNYTLIDDDIQKDINFDSFALAYYDTVIAEIHRELELTNNDVLVLELRVANLLMLASERKNETVRKTECQNIIRIIDEYTSKFSKYISEQGKLKDSYRFFNEVKGYATDMIEKEDTGWWNPFGSENNKTRKAALEWIKKIPYMYN